MARPFTPKELEKSGSRVSLRHMNRPLKLFLGVIVSLVLALTLLLIQGQNSRSPDRPQPPEADQAAIIEDSLSADTVPAGAANRSVPPASASVQATTAQTYQWIEDDTIKGGIRVVTHQKGREIEFVGTHLLARLGDGITEIQAAEWLEQTGIGKIAGNRNGLLKIAPQAAGIDAFLQLKAFLENAPSGYFSFVEPDYIYHTTLVPDDPGLSAYGAWYLDQIDAFEAWNVRSEASGIIVAVIDTGVAYRDAEFSGNIWESGSQVGYDFVNNDKDPSDDSGHGTAVAGIIGAKGNNASRLAGIAWSVQLMPLKVMDSYGYGLSSDISAAIDWATERNAGIINMSLGGPGQSQALENAIVKAGQAGVAIVCAAGNAGNDMTLIPEYPAAYDFPYVVQVGSTGKDGHRSNFSNYDDQLVDLFAPGQDIEVLWPADGGPLTSIRADGTSFSAPMVSGALALIISEFPGESIIDSIGRLLDGAVYTPALESYSRRSSVLNLNRCLNNYRPQPPEVSWEENPVSLKFGEFYRLEPIIKADSKYTLSWKFNDEPLSSDNAGFLVFDPFLFHDAGTYSVTIESAEGLSTSEPVLLEGTPVPPEVTFISSSLTALPGTEVSLTVSLRSNRDVVVDWYEVGREEPVLTGNRRLTISVYESTAYYAHIKGPYGDLTTDPIQVTITTVNWLNNLTSATEEVPVPLGSRLTSALALVPAYWDIMVSPSEGLPRFLRNGALPQEQGIRKSQG
jgi:PKD repeat protein